MKKIDNLIEVTPFITDVQKEFYQFMLKERYNKIIETSYNKLINKR